MGRFTVVVGLVSLLEASNLAARQALPRTVFISVVDDKGTPVPELRATDVTVTEDGRLRQVLTVTRATTPMKIAVILDERALWSAPMQQGLSILVSALQGTAEIGIFSPLRGEWQLVDFSWDGQALMTALRKVGPITTKLDPYVSLEEGPMIRHFARTFREQAVSRPIVLILSVLSMPLSSTLFEQERADDLLVRDVERSETTVCAVAITRIDPFINTLAEVSGGHVNIVTIGAGFPSAMQQIANELLGQFAVTYGAPTPPKDGSRLRINVNRPGVTVRSPERVF